MTILPEVRLTACESEPRRKIDSNSRTGLRCLSIEGLRQVRANESGAILFVGVFMCTCVVGILWYLAGIGDAILLRERMQEASDAVALSSAMLQARGMNLIVLLNLIMACVLGVRVALKAVQLALLITGVMFSAPPTWGVAAACFSAAEYVEQVVDATRAPINNTLKALSTTQVGIKAVTPPAAIAGSVQVGREYRPVVKEAVAANVLAFSGLPVEEGTPNRLCLEAGKAVVGLLGGIVDVPIPGRAKNRVGNLIGKAVQMGGTYFCELEGTTGEAGRADQLERIAKAGCEAEMGELEQKRQAAERTYSDACLREGTACDGWSPSSRALSIVPTGEIQRLRLLHNKTASAVEHFSQQKCEVEKRLDTTRLMLEKGHQLPHSPIQVAQSGMTPKKVLANWTNGGSDAQLLAVAKGDLDTLGSARRRVKIASWNHQTETATPTMAGVAFSQAELFFDCSGGWQSEQCNGDDDESAMWRLRWRARLRRYDALGHDEVLSRLTGLAFGAEAFKGTLQDVRPSPAAVGSASVLRDLARAIEDPIVH